VKIDGVTHDLWRAVDHEGEVLVSTVTKTRDRKAELKFLKKSMKRHGRPQTIVTHRLRSYGAAPKALGRGDDREMGRWLNNRAENPHLPFRRRERAMLRFRRMRTLQKFASVHASVHNTFRRSDISRTETPTSRPAPLLSPRGAAFLLPDTWLGLGKRRLVRICLTAPLRWHRGCLDALRGNRP
jgi:putative transposase